MGFNHIIHIPQDGGGTLLAVFLDEHTKEIRLLPFHDCGSRSRYFVGQLIAAHLGKADGGQDADTIHNPAELGLPVHSTQNPPCGGGGHHLIAHALRLQLGAGKTGVFPPNMQRYAVFCAHAAYTTISVNIIQ